MSGLEDMLSPGEILNGWIIDHGRTVDSTAAACQVPVSQMRAIIAGDQRITKGVAAALALGTDIEQKTWLQMERMYRT